MEKSSKEPSLICKGSTEAGLMPIGVRSAVHPERFRKPAEVMVEKFTPSERSAPKSTVLSLRVVTSMGSL